MLHKQRFSIDFLCSIIVCILFYSQWSFGQKKEINQDALASLALQFHDELVRSDESSYLGFLEEFKTIKGNKLSAFSQAVKYRLLASYHLKFGQPGDALPYQYKALHFFYSIEDFTEASRIANDIGNAYLLLDNQTEAQKNYHLSMGLADFSTNEEDRFVSYYNYARLKLAQEDTVYAIALLQTYRDACQRFEKYESMSDCYSLMAEIALAQNRKDLARNYFMKALNSSKMTGSKLAEANVLANQAILTFQQGDSLTASNLFHRTLIARIGIGNKRMIADAYFNLGSFHYFSARQDSALYYFEKSRDFCLSNDLFLDAIDAIDVLIQISSDKNEQDAYRIERKEVELLRNEMRSRHESLLNDIELPEIVGGKGLRSYYPFSTLLVVTVGGILLIFLLLRLRINSIWQDTQD